MTESEDRNEDYFRSGTLLIYTIGYEGRSLDDLSQELKSKGIGRLVDVREIARSRKPGFSSSRLAEGLFNNGIEYVHMRLLGSPKALREELKRTGDFNAFAEAYKRHLRSQRESLALLSKAASEKPTVIMCLERDPAYCHRSIIASELQEQGFSVRNL